MEQENKKDDLKQAIPQEEIKAHPELQYQVERKEKTFHRTFKHFKRDRFPPQYIWLLNQPFFTNLIQISSIILSCIFLFFGIAGVLTLVGYTETNIWKFYSATRFYGWQGNAITGIILVILGIIIIWSIPYYFTNNTQKADSYLIIGTGLGILFGIIYLLVILADVIQYLINLILEYQTATFESYFYYPIFIGLITFPVFRVLVIRHVVQRSNEDMPTNYTMKQYIEDMKVWKEQYSRRPHEHYHFDHHKRGKRNRHHGWENKWRKYEK